MEDLEFIKNFSLITVTEACKKAKVNRQNLYNGKVNKLKMKKVREIILQQMCDLYFKSGGFYE